MISPEFTRALNETYSKLSRGVKAKTRDYDWRRKQLEQLRALLVENDAEICDALWADLRKSKFECQATEQGVVLSEINDSLKHLHKWMKPQRVGTPMYNWPGRSLIVREPYGLTLIIGAWNYPINLTLAPLVGAIAGGNGCIVKPSEISVKTAEVLTKLIPKYLDQDAFAVVNGGADETGELLNKKFDLIFFTGSGPVGKIVLAKAAPQLTPVVLELGGKSPVIVWKDADLDLAARRIAWGKFMNAGQTCIAPDYLLIHPDVHDAFVAKLSNEIKTFYGNDVKTSPDYCRIINDRNFGRLTGLAKGLPVLVGGATDAKERYIEPTLVSASASDKIMQEEIFGPYLPVLKMSELKTVVDFINERPKPLSLYIFAREESVRQNVIGSTSSGAVVINDVVMHMPEPELPFGGVGDSGMGHYHGRFSFETFTHAKGILRKTHFLDLPIRYPPYNDSKARVLRWLFK